MGCHDRGTHVPDLERCGTRRCVHLEPTRVVVTGYDSGPDVHNHDQDNQIQARLDPKGIYQLSLILTALHKNRKLRHNRLFEE